MTTTMEIFDTHLSPKNVIRICEDGLEMDVYQIEFEMHVFQIEYKKEEFEMRGISNRDDMHDN